MSFSTAEKLTWLHTAALAVAVLHALSDWLILLLLVELPGVTYSNQVLVLVPFIQKKILLLPCVIEPRDISQIKFCTVKFSLNLL